MDNESRSSRSGGDPTAVAANLLDSSLGSTERKDPRKPGPPKKTLQLMLEQLLPDVTPLLREQIEAQLRPQQVLEVDGAIVARGADVTAEDVEAAPELKSDLGETYTFAHRMLWEVYERETAAIDRLSERSAEMFKRNLDMTTQLQRAIQESIEIQTALRAVLEGETIQGSGARGRGEWRPSRCSRRRTSRTGCRARHPPRGDGGGDEDRQGVQIEPRGRRRR